MSTEHYTRCPHCKATFKVNDDQLAAANGQVRCGACMNVFDALAYLIRDDIPSEKPTKERDQAPEPEQTIPEDDQEDELFQDDPDEDDTSEMAVELSDSFMELEKNADKSSSHFDADIETDEDETPEDPDESWANEVLGEDDPNTTSFSETTIDGRTEPTLSAPGTSTSSQPSFEDRSTKSTPARIDIPDDLETTRSSAEKIDFYYQEPETVRARSFISRFLIAFGSFALVLLLLAQVAWFHYEKLAKYPLAKQGFVTACQYLGCTLPELVDLSKIRSHNLVVRSHPTTPNALIIDVMLTNEADFPQDFPRLAMYFSDINDKVVAQQIIAPKDYLSSDVLAGGTMPSNHPIYVSIELEDPGKQAVNYKIRFFPGKPAN